MSSVPSSKVVRRPISLKIFGIAIALLVLMIAVTFLLSDYYIRLDQQMGDVRARGLREVIQMERVLHRKPKAAGASDDGIAALFKEAGDCEDASLRPVLRKIRQAYADRGEQQLVVYRVTRLCTNSRLERANALVEEARALKQVRADPDQVARLRLHASFEK